MYIGRYVNRSKLLLYVRRMVMETRQNGLLHLPFTASKVRTFGNYQLCVYFNLI